jgi:hypothetical protein
MENANLIKRFRETYIELSANMDDDQVLNGLSIMMKSMITSCKNFRKNSFVEQLAVRN